MLGALGILVPEVLEKYAGIEFGVRTCHYLKFALLANPAPLTSTDGRPFTNPV